MQAITQGSAWTMVASALIVLAVGMVGLVRRRPVLLTRAKRPIRWRPFAWGQILTGVFMLALTAPQLINTSAFVRIFLDVVALVSLVASFNLWHRSTKLRP